MHKTKSGFTIVELLIVIVVIGILAAITIVAYNGIQARGRDSRRISDITALEKAIRLWNSSTGQTFADVDASRVSTTRWVGWLDDRQESPQSIKEFLVSTGFYSNSIQDPVNNKVYGSGNRAYMITPCTSGDDTTRVLMAALDTPPAQTLSQQLGGVTCNNGYYTDYVTNYAINYVRRVKL